MTLQLFLSLHQLFLYFKTDLQVNAHLCERLVVLFLDRNRQG